MAERRQHTDAFKRRLVAQVIKAARSVEEIAEANELSPSQLHNWKRDERFGGDPNKFPTRASPRPTLDGIPQSVRSVARGANGAMRVATRSWKYCPNCGERLK